MQTKQRKPLLLMLLLSILLVLTIFIGNIVVRVEKRRALDYLGYLNSSKSLSERVIRENEGYYTYNSGYIEGKPISHYKGQVLASNMETEWERVIDCESNWRHYDKNGNILVGDKHLDYRVYGIAQFQKRTFHWLKQLAGEEHLSIWKEDDQIELLKWAIENNYGYLWSCY